MSVQRLWYPDGLIDETLPTGLSSAQAWADECGPNALELLDESERAHIASLLGPGAIIAFQWMENRGTITIRISSKGLAGPPLRCAETPDLFGDGLPRTEARPDLVTPDINSFWSSEPKIFADTLDDFAGMAAEALELGSGEETDMDVDIAVWSEKIFYRVGADGLTLTEHTKGTD